MEKHIMISHPKPIFNIFTIFALLASLIGSAVIATPAYAAQANINGPAGSGAFGARVIALTNGNYVVAHPSWDNPAGAVIDASAVTLANGIGGTVGLVTSANSVLGTVARGISDFSFDEFRNRLVVGRGASNIVSLFDCPFCSAGSILFLPLILR
jgi:hypothetical protein